MKNLSKAVQYNLEQDLTNSEQFTARKNINAKKIWTLADSLEIEWIVETSITIPDNQSYIDLGTIPTTVRSIKIYLTTMNGYSADFAVKFYVQPESTLKAVYIYVDNELTNTNKLPAYKPYQFYLIETNDKYSEYSYYKTAEGVGNIVPDDSNGRHQEHACATVEFNGRTTKNALNKSDETLSTEINYSSGSKSGIGYDNQIIPVDIEHPTNGRVGIGYDNQQIPVDISPISNGVSLPYASETGVGNLELLSFSIEEEEEGSGS